MDDEGYDNVVAALEAAAFERAVAALEADAFERAAAAVVTALRGGDGLRLWFQPGDATRYLVEVGRRKTMVISNGEPDEHWLGPQASVHVTFGTDGDVQTVAVGRISRLRPKHGWTAAVWRRLWGEVQTQEELV